MIPSSLVSFMSQNRCNVSNSNILACHPVFAEPMCLPPVTWMVVLLLQLLPLFGWVQAYPCSMACTANAIFPQLELMKSLSREFERGHVCQLYSTTHSGRGGDGIYSQIRGGHFRLPSLSRCHRLRTARSHLASLLPVT